MCDSVDRACAANASTGRSFGEGWDSDRSDDPFLRSIAASGGAGHTPALCRMTCRRPSVLDGREDGRSTARTGDHPIRFIHQTAERAGRRFSFPGWHFQRGVTIMKSDTQIKRSLSGVAFAIAAAAFNTWSRRWQNQPSRVPAPGRRLDAAHPHKRLKHARAMSGPALGLRDPRHRRRRRRRHPRRDRSTATAPATLFEVLRQAEKLCRPSQQATLGESHFTDAGLRADRPRPATAIPAHTRPRGGKALRASVDSSNSSGAGHPGTTATGDGSISIGYTSALSTAR